MEAEKKTSDLADTWNFVKTLKVEPFVFLAVLSYFLKNSVSGQLTQDKICMTDFGQDKALCYNVTTTGSAGHETLRDRILERSGQYGIYGNLITLIPAVAYAMFLGSWTDRFPSGPKIIMLGTSLGVLLDLMIDMVIGIYFEIQTPYTLLSIVPSTLCGGVFTLFTAMYGYAIKTTAAENMILRFAVLEVMMGTAQPLAIFLPSRMLNKTPWFFPDIIRNYVGVYTVTICILIPAIIWAYFFIDSVPKIQNDEQDQESGHEMGNMAAETTSVASQKKWYTPLKSLVDLQNVKTMAGVFLKTRPENGHRMLWLVTLTQTLSLVAGMGEGSIQYQFVQKHFSWGFEKNGDVNTYSSILRIFIPMLVVPFLLKKLKMTLPVMGMIGSLLSILAVLIKGVYISEIGYFASLAIGLPSSIAGTALGAFSTELVSRDEIGSVMAFRSCLMAVVPLVSSIIYVNLFNATFNSIPGSCFFLSVILNVPLFGLFAYLQVQAKKKVETAKL